jgi:transcriptional regulator with XRE-family HTH domain
MSFIRIWRNAQNPRVTQGELAIRLGVTQSAVSQAERSGTCSPALAARAHAVLGIPLLSLLYPDAYLWEPKECANSGTD